MGCGVEEFGLRCSESIVHICYYEPFKKTITGAWCKIEISSWLNEDNDDATPEPACLVFEIPNRLGQENQDQRGAGKSSVTIVCHHGKIN